MAGRIKYGFEWDSKKAESNQRKHGVSFGNASKVFLDPLALTLFDQEHSQAEDRWITLGKGESDTLFVVCHTFKEHGTDRASIRMVSARKATRSEALQYKRGQR